MEERNLLINSGFEDISLRGWETSTNISLWPFDPYRGQVALILGLNPLAAASIRQEVQLPPERPPVNKKRFYRLQFYALGSLVPPAKFSAVINLYNEQNRIFRRFQLLFPNQAQLQPAQYQPYTLETGNITPASGLSKIEVRFNKYGGEGTVLLDEISLI